ncbi:uncharacterized protein LOC120326901 [Styela clava]|uniref:uncharacterized protein LOC120326901 n=1 Tax=Styela clava TaxID=7725 RepID=UPI00193A2FCD|nr:uncharacterized protein LOC120326901 [Styela clava]
MQMFIEYLILLFFTSNACGSYFPDFFPLYPPTQPWESVCQAKFVTGIYRASLKGCGMYVGINRAAQQVTSPAKIKNIKVTLFITNAGDPALNIAFDALSPNSPQSYEIDVRADMSKPIYCGKISTPKPERSQTTHSFVIDMTCSKEKLTPGEMIEITITPQRGYAKTINYQIPGCKDKKMEQASKCKQLQKQRIQFRLKQIGNGTMVILDIKSTYPLRKQSSGINLMLRLRNEKVLLGWVMVGDIVQLKYPTRKHLFKNLTPGEHYSVLVWTDSNSYVRYSDEIILRSDIKKRRHAPRRKREYY